MASSTRVAFSAFGLRRREIRSWRLVLRPLTANKLVLVGTVLVVVLVLTAAFASVIAPHDPLAVNVAGALKAPSPQYWLGTDRFGRDILSRIIYGSRVSLWVAVTSVGISATVGTVLGLVSGYFGGGVDNLISRLMDILFSFPALLLAIAVAAMLGPGLGNTVLAIAVVYSPLFSRVVRGPVLAERGKEYVEAARVVGARSGRIIARHILPNVLSPIIVQASITLSHAILIEAYLSYLGLGTQPPNPSWGNMLNEGRNFLELAPWTSVFPGLAIVLAVLSFNVLGDGLRDLLDPRARYS
jgi:peptide/nickel transport system permease protein